MTDQFKNIKPLDVTNFDKTMREASSTNLEKQSNHASTDMLKSLATVDTRSMSQLKGS